MPEDYRSLLAEYGPGTLAGVLRLLAPGGPDGFNMEAEQESLLPPGETLLTAERYLGYLNTGGYRDSDDGRALARARLWGIFATGETCWWLPVTEDPAGWLILLINRDGWQQLNIPTAEFLHRWADGALDLPVLPHGAVRREWHIIPAGQPVTVPDAPEVPRDPLAQLKTLLGPGRATPARFDWAAIEADLGRPLPPDYKLLYEAYGRPEYSNGEPYGRDSLSWNGVNVPSPLALKKQHEDMAQDDMFMVTWEEPVTDPANEDDLLLCGTTDARTHMAWDTRNPDPARWPVIHIDVGNATIHPGTLTEFLVAGLTTLLLGYQFGPSYHTPPFWFDPPEDQADS